MDYYFITWKKAMGFAEREARRTGRRQRVRVRPFKDSRFGISASYIVREVLA